MKRNPNNKGRVFLRIAIFLFIGVVLVLYPEKAGSGTYTSTAHGNSTTGADRSVVTPGFTYTTKGHCGHCHEMHTSVGGTEPTPPVAEGPTLYTLFRSNYGFNKNELCYACHETFNFGLGLSYGRYGVYRGRTIYNASVHNTNSFMLWPDIPPPGPTYTDYGNCNNCHNPHGYDDGSGVIPSMVFKREQSLCNTCHDGSPVLDNIANLFTKIYKHNIAGYTNDHKPGFSQETRTYLSATKHVECVDCHNPHGAKAGTNVGTQTNLASNASQYAPGVNPTWGTTKWSAPSAFSEGIIVSTDLTFKYEWQICFRCHSSYNTSLTTWNANWTDIAVEFNPNNSKTGDSVSIAGSYHSVVQLNPNRNVNTTYAPVFVSTWTKDSLMMCSDCHTNDAGNPYGPHGSINAGILLAEYDALTGYTGTSGDLCFKCHDWAAYTGRSATTAKTGFYGGGGMGKNLHVDHVSTRGYSCTACHPARPHGGRQKALLLWDPTGTGDLVGSPYRGAMSKDGITYAYNSSSAEFIYVLTWQASGNWMKANCRIEKGDGTIGAH